MKRAASTSTENLEALTQEDIAHKQLQELSYFITSNQTRDYYVLKMHMGKHAFRQALRTLFFDETSEGPLVKAKNPFYSAMDSIISSACSYGINHSYAFQIMDRSDDSTQLDATSLEPFVFTLVQLPNEQFKVMVNRVHESIEIDTGNLIEHYRTYDIRTIDTSRIMSDIGMRHGIATDHFIYQDILSTVENYISLQCAYSLLCTVPYDALCQTLGVARTSHVEFTLNFLSRTNVNPHDIIEKDNFLLLRTIIIGGSFNKFHPPTEPIRKLALLFSHIDTRHYMQENHIIEFLHPYINMSIRIPNIKVAKFLLGKLNNENQRKTVFEKANFELFFTAYKTRNITLMKMLASLLPEDLQRKFFALMYLLTYSEINQQTACWALSRDKLLSWAEKILETPHVEAIRQKYGELKQIMIDRKSNCTMEDPASYQYSDREIELHPPICTTEEDNYHQTLQPLPITEDKMTSLFEWLRIALPNILNKLQDITPEDWQENIAYLFSIVESISSYPKANYLSFRFSPIPDIFYQELLREHMRITDKEQPNVAIQQFFQRGEFRAPLWTHQLDVQHCSKLEAKTVRAMGTLWHAEMLKALQPLHDNNRSEAINTNFSLIRMTFIVTTKEGKREIVELPIEIEGLSYVHCNSFSDQKNIYTLYKNHGKQIVGDRHTDDARYEVKNIPHSEKTFIYYLHQNATINAIAQKLSTFRKLHAIILDIISTNQCCKTCQLMLIGLQSSHNLNGGFLARLTTALSVANIVTPRNGKTIRMVTRYSSFQPMQTKYPIVTGNTPDIEPPRDFIKNTIFHSSTHLEPALPWHPIGTPEQIKQFSEDEQRRHANTVASIQSEEDKIQEQYQSKHDVHYCGTQPLSLKQLCGNDRINRVILSAPQKSTELYLKKPPSMTVKLSEFSLFCSGNSKLPAIEQKWNEIRDFNQNVL